MYIALPSACNVKCLQINMWYFQLCKQSFRRLFNLEPLEVRIISDGFLVVQICWKLKLDKTHKISRSVVIEFEVWLQFNFIVSKWGLCQNIVMKMFQNKQPQVPGVKIWTALQVLIQWFLFALREPRSCSPIKIQNCFDTVYDVKFSKNRS